jgi:hypothetical protein
VLVSTEYLSKYVDNTFRSFLRREANQADRDFWVPILQGGLVPADPNTPIVNPHEQLFPSLICSDDYRALLPTRVLPALTCPPAIAGFSDAGQCGGVVSYPTLGMTCTPAPGSLFPFGTTPVTCTGENGTCQTTFRIGDSQPPTILCPQNVQVPTQGPERAAVSYAAPVAADNCSAVTVECTPASGSIFPIGTTAVTCTATDAAGNTAACSFQVSVGICIQDDVNTSNSFQFDATTGQYSFCCGGAQGTGAGTVSMLGTVGTLEDTALDRLVNVSVDTSTGQATASVRVLSEGITCAIVDSNTSDSACSCP